MEIKAHNKIYIGRNESTILVCPKCRRTMMLDCREYINAEGKVHIRHSCACGHSNLVFLERRRSMRKVTRLPGFYASVSGDRHHRMTVENLSRSGLKFRVADAPPPRVGEELMVGFHLEDASRTYIRKKVVIRELSDGVHAHAYFVLPAETGAQAEKACDRAIANYLFSLS